MKSTIGGITYFTGENEQHKRKFWIAALEHRGIRFSERDIEFIALTADGFERSEIANMSGLALSTVRNIFAKIHKSFHTKNISHLVSLFFRTGLIT